MIVDDSARLMISLVVVIELSVYILLGIRDSNTFPTIGLAYKIAMHSLQLINIIPTSRTAELSTSNITVQIFRTTLYAQKYFVFHK